MSSQHHKSKPPALRWTPQEALEQTDRLEVKGHRLSVIFYTMLFLMFPVVVVEVIALVIGVTSAKSNRQALILEWVIYGSLAACALVLCVVGWLFHLATVRQEAVRDQISTMQLPASPPPRVGERFRWAKVLEQSPSVLHVETVPYANIIGPLRLAGVIGLSLVLISIVWDVLTGQRIAVSFVNSKGLGSIPFAIMMLWQPFVRRWRAERSAATSPSLIIESTRWFFWRSVTVLAGPDLNRIEVQKEPHDTWRVCVISRTGAQRKELTLLRLPKQEPAEWHCRRIAQSLRLILGLPAKGV